jgi:Amt family ammonium transporter
MNPIHQILKKSCFYSCLAFLLLACAAQLRAADTLPAPQLQQAAAPAVTINTGDNAWLLASSALVLMMTAPGLILFYGGLVRTKNVLSTMMHSLVLMGLISMLWMVFGYSMAFGQGNGFWGPFCGNPLSHLFLHGVGAAPDADYAPTIPAQSFMLFQMMFAIITPALISGAVAERIKFSAYVMFMLLWVTVIYFPLCHMVWGKGGFFNWASGGRIPVLDFAGGTVVHIRMNPWCRTTWCCRSSAPDCCGWAGLVSMPAAL